MHIRSLSIPSFAFLALVGCAATEAAKTGSSESALVGTVDPTAASTCASNFCSCTKNGGTTCLDDAEACIEAGTSTTTDASTTDAATTTTATDGGSHTSGKGKCTKDGAITKAGVEECLTELETCAKSGTALETCVADAVTCVTQSSTTTSDASSTPTVE